MTDPSDKLLAGMLPANHVYTMRGEVVEMYKLMTNHLSDAVTPMYRSSSQPVDYVDKLSVIRALLEDLLDELNLLHDMVAIDDWTY